MALNPAAAAGPVTAAGQPVYLPNLVTNNQALYHVKSSKSLLFSPKRCRTLTPARAAAACVAGALAGLLGLTNLNGFALYFAVSFGIGALYTLVNCKANPSRYFLKPSEPVLSGTVGNCFPFILFWTREPLSLSRCNHCFVQNLDTDSLKCKQCSTRSCTVSQLRIAFFRLAPLLFCWLTGTNHAVYD